jgi:hypothetical protein
MTFSLAQNLVKRTEQKIRDGIVQFISESKNSSHELGSKADVILELIRISPNLARGILPFYEQDIAVS